MIFTIQKNDVFECIKTFKMNDGEKAFIKGNSYISEVDYCITDEQGDAYHNMQITAKEFFNYFKLRV